MIPVAPAQFDDLILSLDTKIECSDLGFFSKPFRITYQGEELIIKTYLPLRNNSLVSYIIENHNKYVAELNSIGIKIPDTTIAMRQIKGKQQIIIIQKPFHENELLRSIIKKASITELFSLCQLIFKDIQKFWSGKKVLMPIGFHPTLRNYALRQSELYYLDTFPPMLMEQKNLNHLILTMAPYETFIKKIIPSQLINRVSNEYYHLDKMFSGVVGSCCRLRPEFSSDILEFSLNYLKTGCQFSGKEKESTYKLLQKPPDLSGLWILVRKLTGNKGEPNIKTIP